MDRTFKVIYRLKSGAKREIIVTASSHDAAIYKVPKNGRRDIVDIYPVDDIDIMRRAWTLGMTGKEYLSRG